jgi:hypothetical protein
MKKGKKNRMTFKAIFAVNAIMGPVLCSLGQMDMQPLTRCDTVLDYDMLTRKV